MTTPSAPPFFGLVVLLPWAQAAAAVSLNVSPNRLQFFTGESIRLSCEAEESSSAAGQTLRRTFTDKTETCGVDNSFRGCSGSTYTVTSLSSEDQGIYWCEDLSGQKSNNATIIVSDCPFIVDVPALPVMLGGQVTLRCRSRNGSTNPVYLFKYGKHNKPLTATPAGEFTIADVQQSDEGFCWCSDYTKMCPSCFLSVTATPLISVPSLPTPSSLTLLRLLRHLVVISPYCVSTALLASLLCCKKAEKRHFASFEMEIHAESQEEQQNEYYNTAAAAVTTQHFF